MSTSPKRHLLRPLFDAIRIATRPGSAGLVTRIGAVPRLVRASLRGEYRGTARSTLALLAMGVVYVFSPIDLVPEAFLAMFGLLDDAFVITWIAATFVNSTEDFLAWERTDGAQQHQPGQPSTVDAEFIV